MWVRRTWIAQRRDQLGMSMRSAANAAQLNVSTWSRIEQGATEPGRDTLARMAVALRCRIADLAAPLAHRSAAEDERDALLTALVETDPGHPATAAPTAPDQLTADAARIDRAYVTGAFTETATALAWHLRRLHATGHTSRTRDHVTALTVEATCRAMHVLAKFGAHAEAVIAAERCAHAAAATENPVAAGRAAFARAHAAAATGAPTVALHLTDTALEALDRHQSTIGAQAAAGQLHLTAAMILTGQGRIRAATDRIAAAATLADRTGNLGFRYGWFGPTNVGIWRIALETEYGDPERALAQAATVNLAALPAPTRRAAHCINLATAATVCGDPEQAVRHLTAADRSAPELVAHSRRARQTITALSAQPLTGPAAPALALLVDRVGA